MLAPVTNQQHENYFVQETSTIPRRTMGNGQYEVRFAQTKEEIRKAQELRYQVFNVELSVGLPESHLHGRDADRFDQQCDHLLVIHKETGDVIGTYRMQTSEMAYAGDRFYTELEFDLRHMPAQILQNSVEVGRACIHRDHRNGSVLYLLWKGLALYLTYHNKSTLFGCCSVENRSPEVGRWLMNYLQNKRYVLDGFKIIPKPGFECFSRSFEYDSHPDIEIPVLFQKYLDMGAKVCSLPAIDRRFGTIDYMMILNIEHLDERVYKFFMRGI